MPFGARAPDTTHEPDSLRLAHSTCTSLHGAQFFLKFTTIPPGLSGIRIVAPHRLRQSLIPRIEEMLEAGDLPRPDPPPEALGPAFDEDKGQGDDGHRG